MVRRSSKKKKKTFFDKIDRSQYESATPLCPHFGECGGCSLQDMAYTSQVKIKKEFLTDLFKETYGKEIEITSAPRQYQYRNRMDFVYSYGILGLRKKGDFKTVIDLETCKLIPPQYEELFIFVKKLLKEKNIPSFDIVKHEGFLKYVTFRYAPIQNEVMIFFSSTTPETKELEKRFLEVIDIVSKKAQSIYWQINDSETDTAIFPHKEKLLIGKATITEKLGETTFDLSPWSFFQNNSLMSEIVFSDIKKEVYGDLVDVCCGVGTIGLFVADKTNSITGVEEVTQAIELAKNNKEKNNVKNAFFFADDMKNILTYTPMNVDVMIVDPPRAGLGKKTIKRILEASPQKIIYMSCNPKTQKIDLDLIAEMSKYKITSFKGYDMFPQTPHVETIVILEKEENEETKTKETK